MVNIFTQTFFIFIFYYVLPNLVNNEKYNKNKKLFDSLQNVKHSLTSNLSLYFLLQLNTNFLNLICLAIYVSVLASQFVIVFIENSFVIFYVF